jgi:hypothetical protein
MCGAVSPVFMFLSPVRRDNCIFYFYCSHAHISLCANWQGSVGEQTVIMTELTICELCLYHSAGDVSCDCVTVCNLCWLCQESENYGYERIEKLCWIVLDEFLFQSPPQEPYSYRFCNSMYECDPSLVKLYDSDFWVLSQNFWKATFSIGMSVCVSVCLSVCVSARNISAPTGWIFMKFDNFVFLKVSQENASVIKIWQD